MILALDHHVGLEHNPGQVHVHRAELLAYRGMHARRDFGAALEAVFTRHQDFRFDNRNQVGLLTRRGIPGQRTGVRRDGAPAGSFLGDREYRAPFGEHRSRLGVAGQSGRQPVQPLGDGFSRQARARFGPGIDLDARQDAERPDRLGEMSAVAEHLSQGLLAQDDARYPVARSAVVTNSSR